MDGVRIIGGLITLIIVALCMLPGFLKRAKLTRVRSDWPKVRTGMLECAKMLDSQAKFDRYYIKLQYNVNGRDYTCDTTWVEESLPDSSDFDAYYDPADPTKIFLAKDVKDSWIPFAIGGLVSVMAVTIYCAIAWL